MDFINTAANGRGTNYNTTTEWQKTKATLLVILAR